MTVILMTILTGKKLAVSEVPRGLDTLDLVAKRKFKHTPTALIPGVLLVLVVLSLTMIAFSIMDTWPIQFG